MSALDEQVGGSHYKDFSIQPVEFIHKNDLGFIAGNIVKYICRYKGKGGIKDLQKVKHYLEILLEFELNKKNTTNDNNLNKEKLNICIDCRSYTKNLMDLFCDKCKCPEKRKDATT